MRLFLLPISTKRTLIYCQRLNVTTTKKKGWIDWGTAKAANIWAGFEKKESGWQRKLVDYANTGLKRIPYEEWGLKSIPPLSARRKGKELAGESGNVEVHFPQTILPESLIAELLKKLGTERQQLHRKTMIWCFVGMPLVAPFALVPFIPNIPFFYLVFRAWSHWRAWSGSKHVEFLLDNKLIAPKPSKLLDELYASGKKPFEPPREKTAADSRVAKETMLLHKSDGKRIAEALKMPELDMELDRAVWQVEKALKAERELKDEKKKLDSANAEPKEKKP